MGAWVSRKRSRVATSSFSAPAFSLSLQESGTASDSLSTGTALPSGLVGDNCVAGQYGTGTQASAWSTWQTLTARTLQVQRVYFSGLPPSSISAALQATADAGIAVSMSFKPTQATTSGGGSSSDRTTINSFLSSCKTYGLQAMVAMYHEPASEIGNASTFKFTQEYYGPTIRTYYPLVYGGQCGNFTNGNLTTYQNYFEASQFDAAAIDYYAPAYVSGARLDSYASFIDGQGMDSFGLWEFGLDASVVSQANGTAYWNYLASFFGARKTAGKGNGNLTHFSLATPDGTAGLPFFSGDYQLPLYQALWDAVG